MLFELKVPPYFFIVERKKSIGFQYFVGDACYDCLPRGATSSASGSRCRGRTRPSPDLCRYPSSSIRVRKAAQRSEKIFVAVAPFSMPHAATGEDWYEGTYTPKRHRMDIPQARRPGDAPAGSLCASWGATSAVFLATCY